MASKRQRVGLVLISLIMLGIGVWWGNGVMIGRGENQDDIRSEIGLWTPETLIEQAFIASQNQLCRLDFFVDSYHPWDSPYLECRLFEMQTAENPYDLTYDVIHKSLKEIRSQRISGWLISGHMFNSFTFASIPDSYNKRYLLSIQSPGLRKGGTSIILASPQKRYDYGNLFVNGKKQEGDLAFRVLYAQPKIKVIRESVAKLALQKPFPFSQPATYYVVFGVYVTLLIMLFWWL